MVDPNATLPLIEPLTNSITFLTNTVKALVGGIFGLYVILVILRWKEARELKKLLIDVKGELVKINKKLGKK